MTAQKEPEALSVTRVYRGYLRRQHHSSDAEGKGPTFLAALATLHDDECGTDENASLASQLCLAAARHGRRVKLRFAVGDDRHSADPLDPFGTGWAQSAGMLDADGSLTQGTRPGSWVVREKITVGQRDLLKALKALTGKFCHMEVTYTVPAEGDKS